MAKKYKFDQCVRFDGVDGRFRIRANTPEEFAKKKAEKEREVRSDVYADFGNITFERYAELWLEVQKEPIRKGRTVEGYRSRLHSVINPAIGKRLVKSITHSELQRILNSISGCTRSHIVKVRYTIRQIFKAAMQDHLITIDPSENLLIPASAPPDEQGRAATPYEVDLMIRAAGRHHSGPVWLTMYYCGLRPVEIPDVIGKDVCLTPGKESITIRTSKTRNGIRTVVVPAPLAPVLREIITGPFDPVFRRKDGRKYDRQALGRAWRYFKREMQLEAGCKVYRNELVPPFPVADDLTPYCFRHACITNWAIAADLPIVKVAKLAGHSSTKITERYYVHGETEVADQVRDLVNGMYGDGVIPFPAPQGCDKKAGEG